MTCSSVRVSITPAVLADANSWLFLVPNLDQPQGFGLSLISPDGLDRDPDRAADQTSVPLDVVLEQGTLPADSEDPIQKQHRYGAGEEYQNELGRESHPIDTEDFCPTEAF